MSTSKFRVCVKLHKTEERKSYFEVEHLEAEVAHLTRRLEALERAVFGKTL